MTRHWALGIDLGATKIAGALVDDQGKVHAERSVTTKAEAGIGAVVDRLASMVRDLAAESPDAVAGVGIGSPGFIDPDEGVVLDATNLAWLDVPLVEKLREALFALELASPGEKPPLGKGRPLLLQMDTFASTLGEYYFGAARGCRDFVYLSIGSGFSAGLMAEGRLIRGARNLAGQCGCYSLSRTIGEPGPRGPDGNAEDILSGYGFLEQARRFMAEGRHATRLTSEALTTRGILDAASAGDELATAVLREAGVTLAMVMSAYLSFLNPAKIVIGGGLGTAAFDYLVPVVRRELARRASSQYCRELGILPSGQSSSAIGAACLVFHEILPERFPL